MLGGLLATVNVATPPPHEQAVILEALFPSLAPLLRHALAMLAIVQGSPAQTDRCGNHHGVNCVMCKTGSCVQLLPSSDDGTMHTDCCVGHSGPLLHPLDNFGNPAVPLCSTGVGDAQLAALVHTLSAQVAGLRIGRHFSIRDVIKWAQRMQVTLSFFLDD